MRKKISSSPRSADTLPRITDDGYRGGGKEHYIQRLEDPVGYYLGFGLLEARTAFLLEFCNCQFDYFGRVRFFLLFVRH